MMLLLDSAGAVEYARAHACVCRMCVWERRDAGERRGAPGAPGMPGNAGERRVRREAPGVVEQSVVSSFGFC